MSNRSSMHFILHFILLVTFNLDAAVESRTIHPENSIEYDSSSFDSGPLLGQASHSMPIEFHHYLNSIHNKERNKIEEVGDTKNSTKNTGKDTNAVESWCVIWYLGAFGSLVCFFLIITCTELFFGNPLYRDNNLNGLVQNIVVNEKRTVPETPPPPYHLFAPPDYYASIQTNAEDRRKSLNAYIVPVHLHPHPSCSHSSNQQCEPPKYDEATDKMLEPCLQPIVVAAK